jgi:hypothetical protein
MPKYKKPDHKILITIISNELLIDKVPCEVFLPERSTGAVELFCRPTYEQWNRLTRHFEFSIEGEAKDYSGAIYLRIQANKVYAKHQSSQHWGDNLSDSIFIGEPTDLMVISYLHRHDPIGEKKGPVGNFWLTPSIFLTPAKIIKSSYTGDVSVETVRSFQFALENGVQLHFNTHYQHIENENDDKVTFPELVAEFELENGLNDINSILPYLDDFLMIVSFAARQHCMCIGWDVTISDAHTIKYTKYYRRDITIPKIKKEHSFNDTLIDIQEFENFISTSYKKYIAIDQKEPIRQAIYRSFHKENRTLENEFMAVYSALETIVLFFRRSHQMEHVLPEDKWNHLNQDLRDYIKSHPLCLEKEKRKFIYEKLPELNRISFPTAFRELCENYEVDLSDLWPVVERSGGMPLSGIRDKLVHGDTFSPLEYDAVITANEHLKWTLERLILSVLGWPPTKSKVSKNFLPIMTCYKSLENDRKLLPK